MAQPRDLTDVVAIRLAAVRHSKAGNYREAAQALAPAVEARPNDAALLLEYANALVQAGFLQPALAAYDRLVALSPQAPVGHTNRAYALNRLNRHEEAETAARRALELAPGDNAAGNNLAHALKLQGRFAESAEVLEAVVARDPKHVEALNNLGDCRRALGRLDEALALFDRAIAINPHFAHAHVNRALCHFQRRDWRRGFEEYEWRFGLGLPLRHRGSAEAWSGLPAPHRTLYVETEQGHGDAIQFMRLIRIARARVERCVLMARPEQTALLGTANGVDATVTKAEKLSADALHVSLLSLPHLLGCGEAELGMDGPYLAADPARIARWRRWLETISGRRIGICWQGTPGVQPDLGRSLSPAALAPLAAVPDLTLVSLQKRHGVNQLEALPDGVRVVTPPDGFDDGPDAFLDSAALIKSLDHVVSVDTAIAHLAGALAQPVSLLLRKIPDWRWGVEGETTLWYPSMQLYRQSIDRDWTAPVERLAAALAAR